MKLDLTLVLKNYNGKPLQDNISTDTEKPEIVDLTLKNCLAGALMHTPVEERRPDANKRISRFMLATEIHKNDEIELGLDELGDLKMLINDRYNTPVAAAAMMLLDPAKRKKKEKKE